MTAAFYLILEKDHKISCLDLKENFLATELKRISWVGPSLEILASGLKKDISVQK